MRLTECYIENFGKLSAFKRSFSDGLNVINEDNGYGKTTLSVFIKSMLYGIDAKKIKGEETDRKKYFPWQGGRFGGSLTFEANGKKYRIERTFGERASADAFSIYDARTGAESSDFSENVGEELFGIDADGFERTVFLSEKKLSVKTDNQTISAKLSDLVGVDGDMGNLDKALIALEKREKQLKLRRGKGGLIWDIKADVSALDSQLIELERKKDGYRELEDEAERAENRIKEAEAHRASLEKSRLSAAYEKEYLAKLNSLAIYKERLDEERKFFARGGVRAEEIRYYEEKYSRAALIRASLSKEAPAKEEKPADDLKIEEALRTVERLKMSKNVNKTYPLFFLLSFFAFACGALLGAFVSVFLYTVCAISPIFLFLGIKNKRAVSSSSEIDCELNEISDFVYEMSGRRIDNAELHRALLELKVTAEARRKEYERREVYLSEKKAEEAELTEDCRHFLSRFPISTEDPFGELRAHLLSYENLTDYLLTQEREAEKYRAEHFISPDLATASGQYFSEEGLAAAEERLRSARAEYYAIENRIALLSEQLSREDELKEARLELNDKLSEAELAHRITLKAAEHLSAAKERLTAKYLGRMLRAFEFYIDEIGKEEPTAFALDTSFALRKTENGLTVGSESYSLGTREFYSLATRFALTDALYEENMPFMLLDDPFCHYDDKKCAAALRILKKLGKHRQIIYFTCSDSRTVN